MSSQSQIVIQYASAIGLLAALSVPYGLALAQIRPVVLRQIALGIVFGAASMLAMLTSLPVADGVFFDLRSLPVALAGAFAGPISATVCALMAGLVRFSIGGEGTFAGLLTLVLSAGAGLSWRAIVQRVELQSTARLVLLGLVSCLHLTSILTLPHETMMMALELAVPLNVALTMVGAVVVGSMIQREDDAYERSRTLAQESLTDPLTGIANRRGFEQSRRIARAEEADGNALLLIDIDHFKAINDTYGHPAGDAILRQLADRLAASIREGDLLARYGGEEFALHLRALDRSRAEVITERLRRAIADEPFIVDEFSIRVTISAGVHWQPEALQDADWENVIRATDRALFTAKALGRDCVVFTDKAKKLVRA